MVDALFVWMSRLPYFRGRDRLLSMLQSLLTTGPRKIGADRTILINLDPAEWSQLELILHGETEPETTALIKNLLDYGDNFVDIGSHIGYFSLLAAQQIGPTGHIIAIDPQPENCAQLMHNAQLNGFTQIMTVNAAVSPEDGVIDLMMQPASDRARLSLADASPHESSQRFVVASVRLDSLVRRQQLNAIKLIKIDVEGFEEQVMQSGVNLLHQVDNIIFEYLPDAPDIEPIKDLLESYDYELHLVDGQKYQPGIAIPENNMWAKRSKGVTEPARS